MSADDTPNGPDREPQGQHLATISHEGRFWDVYLEFEDDARRPDSFRARFAFSPGDPADDEGLRRTTIVIIENSFDEAIRKAQSFDDRHLSALLRSTLD